MSATPSSLSAAVAQPGALRGLAGVYITKIAVTLLCWALPLLLMPAAWLEALGLPPQPSYLFLRLLGWAYLALCVGYGFGLQGAARGVRLPGPLWVGIVSNGGASLILTFFGVTGSWAGWSILLQALFWGSALATGAITAGLVYFGVWQRGRAEPR